MKKIIRVLALVMALSMMLAACGGSAAPAAPAASGNDAPAAAAPAGEKVLTIAIQDEVEGCDIQQIGWENVVQSLIYEPLVVFNKDLSQIIPAFAESYTVAEDGSYLEFKLPADAKFSNGDVCDADALIASEERFMAISEYSGDLDAVTGFEKVDDQTVRYMLSGSAPYMWASIGSTYGGLNNVKVAEEMGDEAFNRCPVTNGPYCVENWEQGSQITLVRNPYYKTNNPDVANKGILAFDKIVVRFIPDQFTRVAELGNGVDMIFNVPSADIADLEANPDVTTYRYSQAGVAYLNLQTEKDITADIAVRQAMTLAVNRDELVVALDGVVNPTFGFISPAMAGFSAAKEAELAQRLAYNPEKAMQILEEAGWVDSDGDGVREKDGVKLSVEMLIASDRASMKNSGPVLQKQFAAIGVDAQIREYESSYIKQMMKEDNFVVGSRVFEWADADILYYVFTEASGYPWDKPEVTESLLIARQEDDAAKRVEDYAVFSELMANEYKAISLFADDYCVATTNAVTGVAITNDGRVWFNDADIA